jgi:phosphate transport system protein
MAKHLQNELNKLKLQLLSLGAAVEESVQKAVKSVATRDINLAKEILESDEIIDKLEVEVEEEALKILALYQPVANDLRMVVAILKINNDLERIGDLSVNIAEQAYYVGQHKNLQLPFDFQTMAEKTAQMLKKSLDSLVKYDANLAYEVCYADDEVDKIHRSLYPILYSEVKREPNNIEIMIRFLSISRNVERIADYTTNIAEDVIYMINGSIVRHQQETFSKS